MLAQDESKHYEVIKALQKGIKTKMIDSKTISKAKNIFQNIVAMPESVQAMKKDLDGYRFAMKIEADSVKLYEEMWLNESDVDTKSLIKKIISEEKDHFIIIENIYEFVQKPEYYLAWSEFSNLQTF
jgi:rubrerythrin